MRICFPIGLRPTIVRTVRKLTGSMSYGSLLFAFVLSLFPLHATHASIWTGATSTDWFDAGNWSGGVPTSGIDANINTTVNAPMIAGVGATNGYLYLGNTATGLLNISSGGTLTSNNIQNIGTYSGYTGIATVSGSGSSWSVSTTMRVGNSGDGQLIIDQGGQVSNVMALIGRNVGSSGLVLVSGTNSRWVNSDLSVGSSGQGTLNITASGYVSSTTGSIALEEQTKATGSISLSAEHASSGMKDISTSLNIVVRSAHETDKMAKEVLVAANDLMEESGTIESEIRRFLVEVQQIK